MEPQKSGTGIPSEFPPNFEGELPLPRTQEELRRQLEEYGADISDFLMEELLKVLVKLEEESYEAPDGLCFHRRCGGGSMVLGKDLEMYCANCGKIGKLPIFSSPESGIM